MSTTKRKADPIHFDALTEIQKSQIVNGLNLDLELDFIIKSTTGDTKIKFSETLIYRAPSMTNDEDMNQIDGTNLFFAASTYVDIVEIIEDVLMTRFTPLNPKLKGIPFNIASLPVGSSIFGKTPQVKGRACWNSYIL